MEKPILVIGHKNPDLDSIASALGYAYMRQQEGVNAVAARAGKLNLETKYVLDYFHDRTRYTLWLGCCSCYQGLLPQ